MRAVPGVDKTYVLESWEPRQYNAECDCDERIEHRRRCLPTGCCDNLKHKQSLQQQRAH